MSKLSRHKAIREIIEQGPIVDQKDLQRRLHRLGLEAGQATLSRDIRELGLVKSAGGYSLPAREAAGATELPSVDRLVREFVTSVRTAQNLLVTKTSVGSAQPVAAALDEENWPEALGTIAGDDTILIVCQSNRAAERLASRMQVMLG